MNERDLFAAAIGIEDPAMRQAFVAKVCRDDAALRQRIEELLRVHDQAGSLLQRPTVGLLPTVGMLSPATPAEPRQVGPYKLRQLLGEGGMGSVWLADQTAPVQRRVALKIIKAGMDSAQIIARFEQERQALAMMDHPHIAKVLDGGTTPEGLPYFVMELVKGIPITKYCDQEHLTPQERLALFIPVCQAVQHAHQKGVIHRDLKPSNVLIGLYDGKPIPKVIDFGVAKATAQKLSEETVFTALGQVVGTFEYMAPEQAELNNLDIDTRADIYSLGVLLYELLTGSPPFPGKQLRSAAFDEMLRIIREVEPPKPSTKLSSSDELPNIAARRKLEPKKLTRLVSGDLDWIVMKCLEKERGRRYESAAALAQDLQRYLADEPVQAGPPSRRYRLRKFLRRNKGPVAAVAVVMLVLILGIIGTTLGMVWATEAEADAVEQARKAEMARGQEEHQRRAADQARQNEAAERKKADREKELAEARRRQAEAVAGLLESVFRNLRPGSELAGQTELKDRLLARLEEAEAQLDHDDLDPLTQARLQNALGLAYISLGEAAKAVPLLQSALEKRKIHRGADHPDTLISMNNLAVAYEQAGQYDLALPLFVETLRLRQKQLGPDHLETLATMHNLASTYWAVGRVDLALPLFMHALTKRSEKLGADHPETLATKGNLAATYQRAGQLEKAVSLYVETLDRLKAVRGADHPETLAGMHNLAGAYRDAGKLKLALDLCAKTLEKRKAKFGTYHLDTLRSMSLLALIYENAHQFDLALPLYDEAFQKRQARLGAEHPETLVGMGNVARVYSHVGKFDKAEPLFEKALALLIAKLGSDHPETLRCRANQAGMYREAGKIDLAMTIYADVLPRLKATRGEDHPDTLACMNNLAVTCSLAEKFDLALPLYVETLEKVQAKLGADHPNTVELSKSLAAALDATTQKAQYLFDRQAFADAEPLLLAWLAVQRGRLGAEDVKLAPRLNWLGHCQVAQHKFPEAEKSLRESLAIWLKKLPNGVFRYDTESCLGAALAGQKKYDEAESLLVSSAKTFLAAAPKLDRVYHPLVPAAVRRVIDLYVALDRPKDAALWRQQLAAVLSLQGLALLELRKYAQAEPLLRECLEIREALQPGHWATLNTQSMLGEALLGQEKYAAAEPLLLAGFAGLHRRQNTIPEAVRPQRLQEAAERLVRLYQVWPQVPPPRSDGRE
jgi:serine/threonine protein kinase/tetratricopeptide (TPR) repeat protein